MIDTMHKKSLIFIIFSLLIALLLPSCRSMETTLDYSNPDNWAYYAIGGDEPVDLFIICPTVDMGEEGNTNMEMDDEETKEAFVGALNMERGIYEDVSLMYAPFYRQMTFPLYAERKAETGMPLEIAYSDVEDAFLYYIKELNDGRPFILAGFSQGAQLALMLMEEHFDDERINEKLVAAYLIGWKITDEDLREYPHLKMAGADDDTGVIISFNTEDAGITDSIIVPKGTKTISINPLNWKRDGTVADKTLNLGACFTDYSGSVTNEIPALTGAYIDEGRGTLKATDITPEDYSNSLFPDGVYHLYDYQFFFRNLEENVGTRTAAYLESKR